MNQKGKLRVASFMLFIGLVGCGFDESQQSNLNNHQEQSDPLLVFMGGNTSCGKDAEGRSNSPYGMSMYRPAYELMQFMHTQLGIKARFVVSCYDDSPNVSYSMSSKAKQIFRGDRHKLDDVIEREMHPDAPVFIMGHSYGGWLAMKSAIVLGNKRSFAGVVTIDPISRVNCSYDRPIGCQESPQDIDSSSRRFINEKSDHWINLYQTKTWYLHASPYKEADKNEKISASHTAIDTHSRTWEVIRKMVESYY